jgi:hypothetical protein
MNLISKLWKEEKLPIRNGLYFANNKSFFIRLKFNDGVRIDVIKEFDLEAFHLSDPEWVTSIDITKIAQLEGGHYFCCGEGANGSEGFFALLDSEKNLLWVVYFEELNPFCDFTIQGNTAIVNSTSGIAISLDLVNPKTMAIISEAAL